MKKALLIIILALSASACDHREDSGVNTIFEPVIIIHISGDTLKADLKAQEGHEHISVAEEKSKCTIQGLKGCNPNNYGKGH